VEKAASNIPDQANYEELLAANKFLHEENQKLKEDNANIWHQLVQLKRHIFGRRSEKLDQDQRQELLFESSLPEQPVVAEDENEDKIEVPAHSRSRNKKKLPADLPRERIEYEPEQCNCKSCGELMARIGEEITEQLEIVPAKAFIVEHAKIIRACQNHNCKADIVTAKLPAVVQVIEGSKAGASLIAKILTDKYCDKIPLNRQEEIFARQDLDISRKRMCDWIGHVTEKLLMPIANAVREDILRDPYVLADETKLKTHVEVLRGEKKTSELKQGYLWGVHSLSGNTYFKYDNSRSGDVALQLFEGYSGYVQTDLYAGYNQIYIPETVVRVGCWAHARRKFVEAQESAKKDCGAILKLISKLYKVEKDVKEEFSKLKQVFPDLNQQHFFDLRAERRKLLSVSTIDDLKALLDSLKQRTLPKSKLHQAVGYTLKQWKALTLPIENGMLELDNNAIERQMRPIAVGRHNWLFAGSERGAAWAACMFSLVATCKNNGINPYHYLHSVLRLTQLPDITAAELTPTQWATREEEFNALIARDLPIF